MNYKTNSKYKGEIDMKNTYYHSTSLDNLGSILTLGLLPANMEHLVYLCKNPSDCLKFAYLHGLSSVLMCEVRVDDDSIVETFDHSFEFFECRCFASTKVIECNDIVNYSKYDLTSIQAEA